MKIPKKYHTDKYTTSTTTYQNKRKEYSGSEATPSLGISPSQTTTTPEKCLSTIYTHCCRLFINVEQTLIELIKGNMKSLFNYINVQMNILHC